MIVIQFLEYLFHDGFTEQHSLCAYTEFVTVLSDGRHLTVVQIDNLPVTTDQSFFLLLKIFRIDS